MTTDQRVVAKQEIQEVESAKRAKSGFGRLSIMITGDVQEGRYAAALTEEAQAAGVAIARELPVISEKNTSAYSIALIEKAKEEAKAMLVVEDYSVLVGLIDKYVGAVQFDEDETETYAL